MARITKTSALTNIRRTMEFSIYDQDEFDNRLLAYKRGDIDIDTAFPLISVHGKHFIVDGITADEWNRSLAKQVD
jgi:hypothetical protein